MHKRKTLYLLALAALFAISCSLTNGETIGAAVLTTPSPSPTAARIDATPSPSPTQEFCTVITGAKDGRLNLRRCAGTSCEVLAVLEEGDRLQVIDAGNWHHVQTDAGKGWINSNYCKSEK